MAELEPEIDMMFDKIKNPHHKQWHGSQGMTPMVYESPDGGETVYARPFGMDYTHKVLVKGTAK